MQEFGFNFYFVLGSYIFGGFVLIGSMYFIFRHAMKNKPSNIKNKTESMNDEELGKFVRNIIASQAK